MLFLFNKTLEKSANNIFNTIRNLSTMNRKSLKRTQAANFTQIILHYLPSKFEKVYD